MIAAIALEVPDYARAMEGKFGQLVRMGSRSRSTASWTWSPTRRRRHAARDTYLNLGRGEFHAGRSLDALMAAYRVGARLAWRRFVEAGVGGELPPEALYSLGEAMFAYIDEISANWPTATPRSSRPPPARASGGGGGRAPAGAGPAGRTGGGPDRRGGRRWALPRRVAALVAAADDASGAEPRPRRAAAASRARRGDAEAIGVRPRPRPLGGAPSAARRRARSG